MVRRSVRIKGKKRMRAQRRRGSVQKEASRRDVLKRVERKSFKRTFSPPVRGYYHGGSTRGKESNKGRFNDGLPGELEPQSLELSYSASEVQLRERNSEEKRGLNNKKFRGETAIKGSASVPHIPVHRTR